MKKVVKILTTNKYFTNSYYLIEDTNAVLGNIVNIYIKSKKYLGVIIDINCDTNYKLKECTFSGLRLDIIYINRLIEMAIDNYLNINKFFIKMIRFISKRPSKVLPVKIKSNIKLTEEQYIIKEKIKEDIKAGKIGGILKGVTGSGKTEIYLSLISDLELDQVLILQPEIGLVNSFKNRFYNYTNIVVDTWTSIEKRKKTFSSVGNGVSIIVGTRSSIFLPFNKLSLIIVDEEHSSSYREDNYDLLKELDKFNCYKLLVSATPSINSIYKYKEVYQIENQYIKGLEKKTTIIKARRPLSNYFINRLKEEISNNHQVLVYINRKGYNYIIICKTCNNRYECFKCNKGLVYYKKLNIYKCNSCKEERDKICNICKGLIFTTYGIGVENIREQLEIYSNKILVVTSDEDVYTNFKLIEEGQTEIIIGTQAISKGYDFSNITLVLISNIQDNLFDYRQKEILLQTLLQVRGRAGRKTQSELIIETKNIDFNIDYDKFIIEELNYRKENKLPPYYVLLKIIHKDEIKLNKIYKLYKELYETYDIYEEGDNYVLIIKIEKSIYDNNKNILIKDLIGYKVLIDTY